MIFSKQNAVSVLLLMLIAVLLLFVFSVSTCQKGKYYCEQTITRMVDGDTINQINIFQLHGTTECVIGEQTDSIIKVSTKCWEE